MAPLIVVVFGYTLFGESITRGQIVMLIVSFGAIQLIIFGGTTDPKEVKKEWWAWVILFLNPFAVAIGQLMTRKLKKLHENCISCYSNLAQLLVFTTIIHLMGNDLSIFWVFSYVDIGFVLAIGLFTILGQTMRAKAL